MPFEKPLLGWNATGIEPPLSLKDKGWEAQQKPPAPYFNWAFHLLDQALTELQGNAIHKEVIGKAGGVAGLDVNGKVLNADGTSPGEVTKLQFDEHTGQAATTLKVGHVQLSDAVTSNDVTKAATSNAVKKAYDRADAAFQSASDGKTAVASAVTAKGVAASSSDTFSTLATKIGQIQTGKKYAKGELSTSSSATDVTVSGLDFKPRLILIGIRGSEENATTHTFWSSDLDATRAYLGGTNNPYFLSDIGHYVTTGGFKLKRWGATTYPAFWIAYE